MNSQAPLLACTGSLMLGGSTTFLVNLGHSFRERGLVLETVNLEEGNPMAADFAAAGAHVRNLPTRGIIYEDRIRQAYQAMAETRPAGVLACLGSESFETLRLVPTGTVRLGIIQSDDPAPYQMTRHYVPWLDVLVGVSEAICRRLRDDPVYAQTRIEHIPYGIHFGPATAHPPRDPAQPLRLIYLGRMIEEQKRVSRLAELARRLAARGEPFEFTFAGSGRDLPALKESLKDFPNVRFLGDVPNSETRALLRSQDVFVMLSDYEGLPLSLLEAMGEGVVPVTSDLESGLRDVVTENTGIRVPVGDVGAAVEVVSQLARDSARHAALSVAASKLVREEYSAARMGKRYLDLIGELSKTDAAWPADVNVPTPQMLRHPWLYRGLPRHARRLVKNWSGN